MSHLVKWVGLIGLLPDQVHLATADGMVIFSKPEIAYYKRSSFNCGGELKSTDGSSHSGMN